MYVYIDIPCSSHCLSKCSSYQLNNLSHRPLADLKDCSDIPLTLRWLASSCVCRGVEPLLTDDLVLGSRPF